jgi:predicted phage baseplate assembly protein
MLPEVQLDDRRFQDLVSEGRRAISQACPEWTEHNVSDPGITLIEQFAWMTEQLIYRLNRVPEKVHAQLLDLLGVRLNPPLAARAELRFGLAAERAGTLEIPAGTEVATLGPSAEAPTFRVEEPFAVPPVRLAAYALSRGEAIDALEADQGVVRPQGALQVAFDSPPRAGDAIHVGFDEPIARLVLELRFEASQSRGAAVDPQRPPLVWEVSGALGPWEPVEVLEDLTGGFNYGSGTVRLQIPAGAALGEVANRRAHWVRCRLVEHGYDGLYAAGPEIYAVEVAAVGALVPAVHAASVEGEVLGVSDGTPGQRFRLSHAPVLRTLPGERLEVRDPETSRWERWEEREGFEDSREADRHYVLDAVSGVLELGPAVRWGDGGWMQYGAIPPRGAELRMSAYRHGGGRRGNAEAWTLNLLRTAVEGVDTVTNPRPASGGIDAESFEQVRTRASMIMRSRDRAVTAEDYEFMCLEATPRVARARCSPADDGGAVRIHLLPRVEPADRRLMYDELVPSEELMQEVREYLDERRPVGVTVQLLPVQFRAVSVVVDVQGAAAADPYRIEEDLVHALNVYVNPLVGGSLLGPGRGWEFGRTLNQGELYGVIHSVEGVEFVRVLRMFETDLATGGRREQASGTHVVLEPGELVASGTHLVQVSHRDD